MERRLYSLKSSFDFFTTSFRSLTIQFSAEEERKSAEIV
jgi:hypothetical protein